MRAPDDYEELKGKTLRIYVFLLQQDKPLGAREIQRRTGISSPSLALYHLSRLLQLGLVSQDRQEGFTVARVVKNGMLTFFVMMERRLIPRFFFYAVFATCFLLTSLVLFFWTFEYDVSGSCGTGIIDYPVDARTGEALLSSPQFLGGEVVSQSSLAKVATVCLVSLFSAVGGFIWMRRHLRSDYYKELEEPRKPQNSAGIRVIEA